MIALCGRPLHARPSTLCNRLLRTLTLLLETRIIIKISTQDTLTDFHGNEAKKCKCVFLKKKFKMADSKNIPPILNIFFQKFDGLVLGLVGLIDVKGIDVAQPIWS